MCVCFVYIHNFPLFWLLFIYSLGFLLCLTYYMLLDIIIVLYGTFRFCCIFKYYKDTIIQDGGCYVLITFLVFDVLSYLMLVAGSKNKVCNRDRIGRMREKRKKKIGIKIYFWRKIGKFNVDLYKGNLLLQSSKKNYFVVVAVTTVI